MKKFTSLCLLLAIYFLKITISSAQEIDINWSDKQIYDNNKDGFFDAFVGYNSKYIYAKFDKLARRKSKIKLVAFDKKSMDKEASIAVIGYKENQSSSKNYSGMTYYKTIVFEDIVYVFWTKMSYSKNELYVQTFDSKLNPLKPLKKIYELVADKSRESTLFVMGNKNSNEQIVIGGELPAKKGENIKVEYKVLKSDFSFLSSNQITLPVTSTTGKTYGLTSSYKYGDDGNLYVRTMVSVDKEDIKNAKSNKTS